MAALSTLSRAGTSRKRRTLARPSIANELTAALAEMHHAITTGDRSGMTVREVEIPDPPAFDAAAVKALRKKLGASIAVFAQLCGVSGKLVEHWEHGRRVPAPLACRLLQQIRSDPTRYFNSLVVTRAVKT